MHHVQHTKRRPQSPSGVRRRLRGAQPVAGRGSTGDDPIGGQPRREPLAGAVPRRAVRAPVARGAADAGGGPGVRKAARRAGVGRRGRHRCARVRSGDLGAKIPRHRPAPAGADDRAPPAGAPVPVRAEVRGCRQHALAARRPRPRIARGARRCADRLDRAEGRRNRVRAVVRRCRHRRGAEGAPGAARPRIREDAAGRPGSSRCAPGSTRRRPRRGSGRCAAFG